MNEKENYEKIGEFAKDIVRLAAENGMTVLELRKAADVAKGMANNSLVTDKNLEAPKIWAESTKEMDAKALRKF